MGRVSYAICSCAGQVGAGRYRGTLMISIVAPYTSDCVSNVSQTNSRDSGSGTPAAPIRDSGTTLMANQNPLRVVKTRGDINELGVGSCFPQRHGRRHVDRQKMSLFQWHVRIQLTPDLHNALSNLSGAMSAHPPCFCNGAPL